MSPINERRVVVVGDGPLADGVLAGLADLGCVAVRLECGFASESEVRDAMAAVGAILGGIDQVVHAWYDPSLLRARPFAEIADGEWATGCEHSLAVAWWIARSTAAALKASSGSLVFVVPTIGMAGAAEFAMLAAVAEGVRVLAKGCGRQWGAAGATVNIVAAAPHHWVDVAAADTLTRGISLSTPAFGGAGAIADDLTPLIALLADDGAHFLTAATLVADGGTWVGL